MVDVDDEMIYRLRQYSVSERVRIAEIDSSKKTPRYVVEFMDGVKSGDRLNVPGTRLHGSWSGVRGFDELMGNWESIDEYELTDSEESAVSRVFDLLIPNEVATCEWFPVHWHTRIKDTKAIEQLIGVTAFDLLNQCRGFRLDGDIILSPEGTMLVSRYACRVNPMQVLDWIEKDEEEYREKCRKGSPAVSWDNKPYTTDPASEYQWYLEDGRPLHELLRSWCGQRAVTMKERMDAAEAEVRRLDELIEDLFVQMRQEGYGNAVEHIERAYNKGRITAYNHRRTVERPLDPSEIPVRIEYRRAPRWWGY